MKTKPSVYETNDSSFSPSLPSLTSMTSNTRAKNLFEEEKSPNSFDVSLNIESSFKIPANDFLTHQKSSMIVSSVVADSRSPPTSNPTTIKQAKVLTTRIIRRKSCECSTCGGKNAARVNAPLKVKFIPAQVKVDQLKKKLTMILAAPSRNLAGFRSVRNGGSTPIGSFPSSMQSLVMQSLSNLKNRKGIKDNAVAVASVD